jgi:predicted Rossmann fold flavoprotein
VQNRSIICIGGGAAGYFCAANITELVSGSRTTILEKNSGILSKVKISGGGRCNVTNITSEPQDLVKYYPRGGKELLGPFHRFNTAHTIGWFEKHGVKLKTENDGRVFPVTDNSLTIVDCLISQAEKGNFKLLTKFNADNIFFRDDKWVVTSSDKHTVEAPYLIITSGSSDKIWDILKKLGHNIITPVPSLFTFNINDKMLKQLPGVSVSNAQCSIDGFNKETQGPLLITHWGLSGPAVLKLSSFAARYLAEKNYKFKLKVNWTEGDKKDITEILIKRKTEHPHKIIHNDNLFDIPLRLWNMLMKKSGIPEELKWKDLPNKSLNLSADVITASKFNVTGKSTFKEEFVTAGGVDLKEVNFKTMESRLHRNLFFAGEVLDIDALTGGFNFQAAWTTAWIAAESIAEKMKNIKS